MSYGIDEKEELLFERKLEELVTTSTGRIGKINPNATGVLDRRALQVAKKPKKTTTPSIGVEPLPEPTEPVDTPTFIPVRPRQRPKIVKRTQPKKVDPKKAPSVAKDVPKRQGYPWAKPKDVPKRQGYPWAKPNTAGNIQVKPNIPKVDVQDLKPAKKPGKLQTTTIKPDVVQQQTSSTKIKPVVKLSLKDIDKEIKKLDDRINKENSRIKINALNDRIKKLNVRRAEVKKEMEDRKKLLRKIPKQADNTNYKRNPEKQQKQIAVGGGDGDLTNQQQKDLEKAQKTQTVDKSGKKIQPSSNIKTGINQVKKDNVINVDFGKKDQAEPKTEPKKPESKKSAPFTEPSGEPKGGGFGRRKPLVGNRRIPNFIKRTGNLIRGAPSFLASTKRGVIGTIATFGGAQLAVRKMQRMTDAEQKALRDNDPNQNNPLGYLSSMQYLGGAGNVPGYGDISKKYWRGSQNVVADFLSPDNTLQRQLPDKTDKNHTDIVNSFSNMTWKDNNELVYSDDFVKNNVISFMTPDGTIHKADNEEEFNALTQPGVVVQIIPTHTIKDGKRIKLDFDERTSNMVTHMLEGETTYPTGVYHPLAGDGEQGGTIVIDSLKYYLPTEDELSYLIDEGIDPPEDWFVDNAQIKKIKNTQELNKSKKDGTDAWITKQADSAIDALGDFTGWWGDKPKDNRYNRTIDDTKTKEPPISSDIDTTRRENFMPWGEVTVDEDEIKNVVNSTTKTWGAPNTKENYEALMIDLAQKSGVDIKLLKTLGTSESLITPDNLTKWKYRGDQNLGKEGSFGIFHVRWGWHKPGAVNDFNNKFKKNYTWKSVATDPYLAATIGAWYFGDLLKKYKGNMYSAYAHYTGGPGWIKRDLPKQNAERFMKNYKLYEGINFSKKSAILEGMSKVNI